MNEAQTLLAIENLMKTVIQKTYRWRDLRSDLNRLREDAQLIYDSNRVYSPLIRAYFDFLPELIKKDDEEIFSNHAAFKQFQSGLREEHKSFLSKNKTKRERNWKPFRRYFDDLVSHHCKLLLVRVDLNYPSETHPGVTKFNEHIRLLLKRIHDKDTIFEGQIGYAYRLEQGGKSRGYHCHLLVIYNGSLHCNDNYYGYEIGRLWKEKITMESGGFFNCNQSSNKQYYRNKGTLGIGMIKRCNEKSVRNAFNVIRYLAMSEKADQYMRVCWKGMNQFNMAQNPWKDIDPKKS
jgi:hypothetical protein